MVEEAENKHEDEHGAPVEEGVERAPDGALRWPAPDRDSPQLGTFSGSFSPASAIGALLQMEGRQGRSETDVKDVTGLDLKRPRRWHKIFERMGILHPGAGVTTLGKLGRILRDASKPDGLKFVIAREAVVVLFRYQFDNPVERALPPGCSIHPYWAVMKAASLLDWKIHWDEVNRELMRLHEDGAVEAAVEKIRVARSDPGYSAFIGGSSNEAGLLSARTHPAEESAPTGKTPEGQLRDQRMTPFLKRVSFGELLLSSPGAGGGGYWTVPQEMQELIEEAVSNPPVVKAFSNDQEWIDWFCEGVLPERHSPPKVAPPTLSVATNDLTLSKLKTAIQSYDPDLVFSDHLLASVIAALRSGDGRSFVILRGVSGTGKSRLVAAIARAVYGAQTVGRPHFTMIEVRPDWTDGAPLLGFYDPIEARYVGTPFLEALLTATSSPEPVFVCLDEMNLARVEYYLSDCLSAMESGNSVLLDTRGDTSFPDQFRWPENIFLFGTVNIDESTLRISDKVLDRAQVIDTSDIEIIDTLRNWLDKTKALDASERAKVLETLGKSWHALRKVDSHFGFRTARAVVRFVDEAKASSEGLISVVKALDFQLCQKVLTKLRGEGDHWLEPLAELEDALTALGDQSEAQKAVRKMRRDLEHLGSFQFWH